MKLKTKIKDEFTESLREKNKYVPEITYGKIFGKKTKKKTVD